MESVFFEKETQAYGAPDKKTVIWKGLLIALGLALLQGLFLLLWLARDSRPLGPGEISAISAARYYRQAAVSGNVTNLLLSPLDNNGMPVPPLYYWTLMPVAAMPAPERAAILLNIIYLALLSCSVFLIVRRNRSDEPALLASAVAVSLPFVLHCAQRISPELSLIAFTACTYASYIWSDEFVKPGWTYLWGFFSILGFLTAWIFPVCVLPVAAMIFYGALSIITGKQVNRVLAAWLAVYAGLLFYNAAPLLLWISRNTLPDLGNISSLNVVMAVSHIALSFLEGLKWYSFAVAGAMQLPFLLLGLVLGLWFMCARFAPFIFRKDILFWVVAPVVTLSVLQLRNVDYILPSLAAFAVAIGVMTPPPARKALLGAVLAFSLLYQSGWLGSAHINVAGQTLPVWESQKPLKYGNSLADMLLSLRHNQKQEGSYEVVVSSSVSLTPQYINWKAAQLGLTGINFTGSDMAVPVYPDFALMPLKDMPQPVVVAAAVSVSTDALAATAVPVPLVSLSTSVAAISTLPGITWLQSDAYTKVGEYKLANGEALALLGIKRVELPPLPTGSYDLENVELCGFTAPSAHIELGPWNPKAQNYDWTRVEMGMLSKGKADLYGVRLVLTGLSFSLPNPLKLQSPVLLRLAGVKVAAVSVNKDSMLDLLQGYFPQFSKLNIELSGNGILLGASYNNTPFAGRMSIVSNEKTGNLTVRCQTLDIAGFTLPDMITRQIAYVLSAAPSAGRPFKVEVGQVLFGKNVVTVSEYDKNTAAPVAMPTVVDRLR